MALEYSEVMAAGAMFYSNRELDAATEDLLTLFDWISETRKKVERNVEFGSSRNEFIRFMQPTSAAAREACIGISAAKEIKSWMTSQHGEVSDVKATKVFLTGNVWPSEVDKFRVTAFGFDDYNASDFIVRTNGKHYYGISLKKKPKSTAPDPTLINKAFDTILNGSKFNTVKNEITQLRTTYFAGLVRQANEDGILDIENIGMISDEELFQAKKRDKKVFDRAYINIKGSVSGGYDNDKASDAMRKFVNKELSKQNNILYSQLVQYMNSQAKIFANSLIDLVLKTQLYSELSANVNLKNFNFGYALVTGVGELKKGLPVVGKGSAYDLHTILEGLNQLAANNSSYKIAVDIEKKAATIQAAKIFFKLSKAGVPILDMELRYKGTFTAQPQFFATITPEFKQILSEKSLVKK